MPNNLDNPPVSERLERRAMRVIVVDDEASVRAFADRALRGAGYDVEVASNGPDVLRLVDAHADPFDLFVVDVVMPQMRGDELGRQIRQRDPDAKVLYLTGYSDLLFADRKSLWQHEAFLEKPATIHGLLEAVSLLLFGHTDGPLEGRLSVE